MENPSDASRSKAWQRRRRRIQQEIVHTAVELFAVHGYESTTVDAIAEAACISPRTLYRYFPAKEDLVFHGFPSSFELLRQELKNNDGGLMQSLRRASLTLSGVLEENRETWISRFRLILEVPSLRARDVILNENYEEAFREAMRREWGRGAEARQRSQLFAGAIMGGIQTAIKMWVESDGVCELPKLTNMVFDLLELPHGARPPEPAAERAHRRSPATGLDFFD